MRLNLYCPKCGYCQENIEKCEKCKSTKLGVTFKQAWAKKPPEEVVEALIERQEDFEDRVTNTLSVIHDFLSQYLTPDQVEVLRKRMLEQINFEGHAVGKDNVSGTTHLVLRQDWERFEDGVTTQIGMTFHTSEERHQNHRLFSPFVRHLDKAVWIAVDTIAFTKIQACENPPNSSALFLAKEDYADLETFPIYNVFGININNGLELHYFFIVDALRLVVVQEIYKQLQPRHYYEAEEVRELMKTNQIVILG